MKDAKGHGSDPKGTHAQGVDQVGRVASLPISGLVPTQRLALPPKSDPDFKVDKGIVDYFRGQLRSGQEIDPPIRVFPNMQVADGHHRIIAALAEGKTDIRAETIPYDYYTNQRWKTGY